jgi:Bacterial transcriptional activator domain
MFPATCPSWTIVFLIRESSARMGCRGADLAYERFAQDEIERLEELRLEALEERIEAQLAGGKHTDVVAELEISCASTRYVSVCADSS